VLARIESLAAHRFRGVRFFANDRANDLSAVHAGDLLDAAAKMAMPVSVLAEPAHLASVGPVARAHSATTIIIDHLGLCTATTARAHVDDLLELGALANVCVRVSAFTALSASGYPFDDLVPLIRAVHAAFGASRLLWGTDYPYVLETGPYRQSLAAVEAMTFLSAGDRDALLGGTAARLYRLN
jgi:L-fuconolactonase